MSIDVKGELICLVAAGHFMFDMPSEIWYFNTQ